MAQTPIENGPKKGDVVINEYDERHNEEDIDVSAYDHSSATNKPDYLVGWLTKSGGALALAADAANVTGIITTADKIVRNAAETAITNENADKFRQIVRGPAIVKKSGINVTDTAGATIIIATVITALKALGITVVDDPAETETQTAH